MAVSPCPKCQDKETFDDMRDPTSCLHDEIAFVVQRTPRQDESPEFFCTSNAAHNWRSISELKVDLTAAGYLR